MVLKSILVALTTSTFFLASGCSLVRHTIEHAPYSVIETKNAESAESENIEVREYQRLLLVTAPMNSGSREDGAFRKLFAYISGENSEEQEISMTAPVFMDPAKTEQMSFVLPESFDLSTAPSPKDAAVEVQELRDMKMAVIRFSGTLSEENITDNRTTLEAWITEQGYEMDGPVLIAGYDPPTSIPWFRRNEVLIPIR